MDECEAFENEVALIWYYGRKDLGTGCLRNLSDGGGKPPNLKGKKFSKEHCKHISESRIGMVFTEEHIQNLVKSHKGKPSSNRGKHPSKATRFKMSASQTGKKCSEETKRKMSRRIPWNYLGRSPEEKKAAKRASNARYRAKKKL
ncbi:MAG: NUMOD3 domain-containing DNA-binding protein [Dehalococcoidia bacterium]